jgi:hypothetical protein
LRSVTKTMSQAAGTAAAQNWKYILTSLIVTKAVYRYLWEENKYEYTTQIIIFKTKNKKRGQLSNAQE